MFGQTFDISDLATVGFLTGLECVLSVDNALVLGAMVSVLPTERRARALVYGLVGAVVLRGGAILAAAAIWPVPFSSRLRGYICCRLRRGICGSGALGAAERGTTG